MKKFILKVLLFFACVVVMDFAFGQFFSYLRTHAKGGSTGNCEYIANQCKDDIIIVGSSRATHHYDPHIIENSLGVTCYNCGEEGNGVVLAYGRLRMLTSRYKPKLVLYELTPRFDYGTNDPNNKYLGYIRAYYDKDGIRDVFNDFDDDLSFLKMQSNMYQNTNRLLPNLVDMIITRDNQKGFEPLFGKLDTLDVIHSNGNKDANIKVDSKKLSYIEKIICLCQNKDIPVVFMISPCFGPYDDISYYEPAIKLCKKYNVPYYDFLHYNKLSENVAFFQDDSHLNNEGALLYTQMVVKDVLKEYLK